MLALTNIAEREQEQGYSWDTDMSRLHLNAGLRQKRMPLQQNSTALIWSVNKSGQREEKSKPIIWIRGSRTAGSRVLHHHTCQSQNGSKVGTRRCQLHPTTSVCSKPTSEFPLSFLSPLHRHLQSLAVFLSTLTESKRTPIAINSKHVKQQYSSFTEQQVGSRLTQQTHCSCSSSCLHARLAGRVGTDSGRRPSSPAKHPKATFRGQSSLCRGRRDEGQ
ncbi:uncharacterized protein IWZ02DRAFT_151797 [Phyllosticta citriasiana]|uniref:uncharacterized protein n=1 Tax=Phyllosticta citriasiana TaxID=595635 RepID=UPI0030FD27B0